MIKKYLVTIKYEYKVSKAKLFSFEVIEYKNNYFFDINNSSKYLGSYSLDFYRLISIWINRKLFDKTKIINDSLNDFNYKINVYMLIEEL